MRGLAALGNPDQTVLDALIAEMLIPGVNGGALTILSTATVDPMTGAAVPANTANGRDVWIGNRVFKGAALRAERATTGVWDALAASIALSSNTTSAGAYPSARTFVEDTTNNQHAAETNFFALTDAVNYVYSGYVRLKPGSASDREITFSCFCSTGPKGFSLRFNPRTLALVPSTFGAGVTVVRSSVQDLGNSYFFVQCTFNATTWGSPVKGQLAVFQGSTLVYPGDGVSGIDVSGYQCELGDYATMPLSWDGGAGVSRAATSNSWAQALGTTVGTVPALVMPYGRNGLDGAIQNRIYEANLMGSLLYDGTAAGIYTASRTDALVAANNASSAAKLAVAGQSQFVNQRWDSSNNRITVNGVTVSSAAPTLPFAAATPVFIGNRTALDRPFEGWVFAPLFPNRAITERERIIYEANTRIV